MCVVNKWERKIGSIEEPRKQAQDRQAHDKYWTEQFKRCGERLNWRHSEMLFIFFNLIFKFSFEGVLARMEVHMDTWNMSGIGVHEIPKESIIFFKAKSVKKQCGQWRPDLGRCRGKQRLPGHCVKNLCGVWSTGADELVKSNLCFVGLMDVG